MKAGEDVNITVFGDSILKGIVLENGRYSINHDWERRLSDECGLTIRNCSRFGCTIGKAMAAIRRHSAQPAEGEDAVLELGGNDCDYDWAAISADPEGEHLCNTPPEEFRSRYREAIGLLRRSGRRIVMLTLPPIHSERYLRFLCRNGLSYDNILRWLGDVEHISRWQAHYNDIVREIAQEEQAELIDIRAAFPDRPEALDPLLCDDGIHPSRSGQKLIYQTLRARVEAAN